jgi:beta-N-acetylhexosaminidase
MIEKEAVFNILSKQPYNLAADGIEWVYETILHMNLTQKIAQLINLQIISGGEDAIEEVAKYQLGAVSVINFASSTECKSVIDKVKKVSRIPPLISADLEGGSTSGHMTTIFPNQLGCAAANSLDAYKETLEILADEVKYVGVNWTFSPVLDISEKFKSAIVGTRSYGSNVNLIAEMANLHIQVFQKKSIATTAKHWPGEGFDDRDQHLVTTINPLSVEEWFEKFGKLYSRAIDNDVLSVMSAHIALPEYAKSMGEKGVELFRPASISKYLNESLLRNQLGFNGVIVSDATLMGGLESWGSRKSWLPEIIQNGCDMILFSQSIHEDIENLIKAVEAGILTEQRIDIALTRVLGLKAKLNLNNEPKNLMEQVPIDSKHHQKVIEDISNMSPTLIKNIDKIVPFNTKKIKSILIFKEENINPLGGSDDFQIKIDKYLAEEGFIVTVFNPNIDNIDDYINYDLIIYVIAQESLLTKSRIYLDWAKIHGGTIQGMLRTWWLRPTILISFGHPYYLYDAPRIPCMVNAYTPTQAIQKAVVEKLLGRSEFIGKSPVDAFCGLEDAHF